MRRSTYTSYKTTSSISIFKSLSLLFVFGAFVYVIYYAAVNQDELSEGSEELQVIQPLEGAVKVRAENPGGMEIPNQNKQVFDLLEETASANVDIPKEDLCAGESGAVLCNQEMKKVEPLQAEKVQVIAKPSTEVNVKPEDKIQAIVEKAEKKVVEAPKKVQPIVKEDPAKKVESKPDVKVVVAEKPKVEASKTASLPYGIQLASYSSKESADNGVAYYQKRIGSLIKGLTYRTESVDVKGRTYYRVQFFGFSNNADASGLCKKIKAKKENCLAIKR